MERYKVTLEGISPLLMHRDNLRFGEQIETWRKDPTNKAQSVKGDDRSPAWTWVGYLYHDGKTVGMPTDNIMTMLREGGAKVPVRSGRGTYKKQTQAGILVDREQFDLSLDGESIPAQPFLDLIDVNDFAQHIEVAEEHGFELLIKRAKIGQSKHVRVRPLFRKWTLSGSLTVIDSEVSGLTDDVLAMILEQAGALCGLGDWRPSSGNSGRFGTFSPEIEKI